MSFQGRVDSNKVNSSYPNGQVCFLGTLIGTGVGLFVALVVGSAIKSLGHIPWGAYGAVPVGAFIGGVSTQTPRMIKGVQVYLAERKERMTSIVITDDSDAEGPYASQAVGGRGEDIETEVASESSDEGSGLGEAWENPKGF